MKRSKKATVIKLVLLLGVFFSSSCAFAENDPRESTRSYGTLGFLMWNHPWNDYHYREFEKIEKSVTLMKEAGVDIVRMDFLWYDLEPEKGTFDFERYDKIVDLLCENDIKILGIFEYNPRWRTGALWNSSPIADDYEAYVRAVATHFKDRVKYWELWNEPDTKFYWVPQDDMKTYTALLKRIYPVLKEVDPSCVVVMGGVSETIPLSLKRIYRNGGKDYFDVVNFHPFMDPLLPGAIGMVKSVYNGTRRIMVDYGDEEKPIWLTELGSPGVKVPTRDNGWWNGMSPTEEEQAQWVREVMTETLKWDGVEKVFWAFFRDTGEHFDSGVDYFGLVRLDFSRKPAYDAYKEIATRSEKE